MKSRILRLLKEDEEFRYAVAGLIGLEEILKRLDRHEEELKKLREDMMKGFERHDIELERLRGDFNRAFNAMDRRLSRVERTLEKLTLDVEDKARSIVRHRLREELGLDVELGPLILPDLELNVYGAAGDVCVVGEPSVRAGVGVLRDLMDRLEALRDKYPDRLRPKIIPVVYTSLAMPELVEEAMRRNVWVLKATQDYYKPNLKALSS